MLILNFIFNIIRGERFLIANALSYTHFSLYVPMNLELTKYSMVNSYLKNTKK